MKGNTAWDFWIQLFSVLVEMLFLVYLTIKGVTGFSCCIGHPVSLWGEYSYTLLSVKHLFKLAFLSWHKSSCVGTSGGSLKGFVRVAGFDPHWHHGTCDFTSVKWERPGSGKDPQVWWVITLWLLEAYVKVVKGYNCLGFFLKRLTCEEFGK